MMGWVYETRPSGSAAVLAVVPFLGVGLWTVLRCGRGGGRAAMKLSMLVMLPVLAASMLGYAHRSRLESLLFALLQIPFL
jgi:hypothetical protein